MTGIITTDVSDHFPNFFVSDMDTAEPHLEASSNYRRSINENAIRHFREILSEANWKHVLLAPSPNSSYNVFLEIFTRAYDKAFPKRMVSINKKSLQSPWITSGLIRSSKKKKNFTRNFRKKELIPTKKDTKL